MALLNAEQLTCTLKHKNVDDPLVHQGSVWRCHAEDPQIVQYIVFIVYCSTSAIVLVL